MRSTAYESSILINIVNIEYRLAMGVVRLEELDWRILRPRRDCIGEWRLCHRNCHVCFPASQRDYPRAAKNVN